MTHTSSELCSAGLYDAVKEGAPRNDLDWARVMFLTEITWASSLLEASADYEMNMGISDEEGIHLLRGLQRTDRLWPVP